MRNLDQQLTEQILGSAVLLTLGIPTQGGSEPRWALPVDASSKATQSIFKPVAPPKPNAVKPLTLRYWRIGGGILLLTTVVLFGTWGFAQWSASKAEVLATSTKPDAAPPPVVVEQKPIPELSIITVEKVDFPSASTEPSTPIATGTSQVFASPLPANIQPPAKPPTILTANPVVSTTVIAKSKEPEKERFSAIVLDKSDERARSAGQDDPKQVQAQNTQAKGAAATPAKDAPSKTLNSGAPEVSGAQTQITVVDISKDGKYVLLTNPQTRLPEKYTVGQKIFTGETILKIDPAAGKIQLTARTIGLQ